jgi:aminoglycoside phosphotransferase (APT) family kinase protein
MKTFCNFDDSFLAYIKERSAQFYPKTDIDLPPGGIAKLQLIKNDQDEINTELLKKALASITQKHPISVELAGHGTFHAIYRLQCNGARYIIRTNTQNRSWPDYTLYVDKWAMEILNVHSLPSVEVHKIDLSRSICPFDYEILDEARGKTLASIVDRIDPARWYLVTLLGKLAAKIHSIKTMRYGLVCPVKSSGGLCTGMLNSWKDYIFLNLDYHIALCKKIKAISHGEASRIKDYFFASLELLECREPSLLHGDFGHHNVFSDGTDITAIIDWEDCLSGDPIFDVAYWGTFYSDEMLQSFLEGYFESRAEPAIFWHKYWLYYLRISLSKTIHRHIFGYKDIPGRPPASTRIQKAMERLNHIY